MDASAAILAIIAAASFALAATLWQKASMSLEGVTFKHPKSFLKLVTAWVWLLGLAAQIAGIVLQGAALDRGRVSIVQPLLVTTIIWAIPLGYFLTGQAVVRREILGAAVTVAGLAVFGVYGDPSAGVDDAPASSWSSAIIVIAALCVALLLFANRGGPGTRAAMFGTTAGILYGLSATLMKPVVENLHTEGLDVFAGWEVWAMMIAGLVGFLLQQISLSTGRLVASVATVSVANPVVSVILGALVLEENLSQDHLVLAISGLAIALLGAAVIAATQEKSKKGAVETGGEPATAATAAAPDVPSTT